MTDQREKADVDAASSVAEAGAKGAPAGITRRAVIRGASIAVPSILTLGTASAQMAMVSALVVVDHGGPNTADGMYYCLDETTTAGFADSPPYPPGSLLIDRSMTPLVQQYPDRNHVQSDSSGTCTGVGNSPAVTELEMCKGMTAGGAPLNGTYCYNERGWKSVPVRKGILLSASSMTSVGITFTNIKNV